MITLENTSSWRCESAFGDAADDQEYSTSSRVSLHLLLKLTPRHPVTEMVTGLDLVQWQLEVRPVAT